jgi:nucleoside-diphosphate-sugar epimerase
VPEGPVGPAPRREVDLDRVRRELARPGDVHRGDGAAPQPRSGFSKDAAEIEGYVRGFARRRPDVRVTMLRLANVVGPHVVSPMTSYFRLPVVPTVLGYDARMQFVHQDDLDRVLRHAVLADIPGTFNIAGDGFLMLSQALRRLQRATVPLPGFAVGSSARCCARRGSPTSRPSS